MYNHYFNFTEQPFSIAPDPHFIYMSERHQEGLAHLMYGIETGGGFVALTGEVGTGKTTLCHCLLQQLPEQIDLALILNPRLNALELLASICDELGIAYAKDQQTLKHLVDALNHYLLKAHAEGRRTVLMIDEAQNLSFEVLEQIRLLTNLETSKTKLLQIILVGQPELKTLLSRPDLRQLNQRISARYHLLPLSLDDTRAYIRHRLAICHGNPGIFSPGAIRKVYKLTGGIPRIINILCDRALLGAYANGCRSITPAIVAKAAAETLNTGIGQSTKGWVISSLLASSLVAAGFYYFAGSAWLESGREVLSAFWPALQEPVSRTSEGSRPIAADNGIEPASGPTDAYLDSPERTLEHALRQMLVAWGKTLPTAGALDCSAVEASGLQCLSGQAQWFDILALGLSVTLEFPSQNGELRYAFLTSVRRGRPVFRDDAEFEIPLQRVLERWNGRYWVLVQPPLPGPGAEHIYPYQNSDAVLWLRRQLERIDGIRSDSQQPRLFDEALKRRVLAFQRSHQLTDDGLVGPETITQLYKFAPPDNPPKLNITD
ncbi:MAG: ExeA family protein [Gammaproteobacteria bacterium]